MKIIEYKATVIYRTDSTTSATTSDTKHFYTKSQYLPWQDIEDWYGLLFFTTVPEIVSLHIERIDRIKHS